MTVCEIQSLNAAVSFLRWSNQTITHIKYTKNTLVEKSFAINVESRLPPGLISCAIDHLMNHLAAPSLVTFSVT